jgi:NhaP-type Na+/H+ or K+/H+ antiporter
MGNFGIDQITNTTPKWAKWFFRIVFLLTKIIVAYVAATNIISPESKYEITLFLTLVIDPLAFGVSKMFGVKIEEDIK